jgi:hypothetical protein
MGRSAIAAAAAAAAAARVSTKLPGWDCFFFFEI